MHPPPFPNQSLPDVFFCKVNEELAAHNYLKKLLQTQSNFVPCILEKGAASLCRLSTSGEGSLCWRRPARSGCPPRYCFSDTPQALLVATAGSRALESGSARRRAGSRSSALTSSHLIHSALHPSVHRALL